jgi:tetratricopeptide (TPR) repeat protein
MGAFMIRHYKTKIRFAYFLWFILIRPYYGTFAIYAGIALPFWFLQQIIFASGGAESGTAHWAHVGGFVFGAVVGISMKIFGIEKKYVAPMVENSFEKLKMSSKMKEVNKKLDTGDTTGAIPLLLMVINEEPQNFDALLMLARIYFEKGHRNDAIVMYKKAFDLILRTEDSNLILSTYEEIREKEILNNMPEKNIYNLASFLEKAAKYEEAVRLFGLYIQLYPGGKVRPKAIYRAYLLFKDKLNNETMAQHALAFLKKEYPEFPIT